MQCHVGTLKRAAWLLLFSLSLLRTIADAAYAQSPFSDNPSLALRDSDTIVSRGILRVAITKFDLPGFRWRNREGELEGPEIVLARSIGQLLKVGVDYVDDHPTFEAVVDSIASGRTDIGISKLSQTPRRILRVRFSDPYLTVRQALLFDRVHVGNEAVGRTTEDALRRFGGSLAVISQSSYVDFGLRNFPNAQLVEMQTWDDSIDALANGRVDAVYRDEFEIRRVLLTRPALIVRFGSAVLTDQHSLLSIAICSSCTRLQQFVNYVIAESQGLFALPSLLTASRR